MAIDEQGEETRKPENEETGPENEETGPEQKGGEVEAEEEGEEEQDAARTPIDRPTRERKTVERYYAPSPVPRSAANKKPFAIAKGSGTQLKDIPNVAYKLSKRKPDDNLQLLHTILFGKKAKVHKLKKDIGLFSGFVWVENEEKQRTKLKEKLDKCVKDKLLDFCDVLNIPVSRANSKKEDLLAKLLEFLQSPHITTAVLLADKEQGKKRKSKAILSRSSTSKEQSAERSSKKAKVGEKQKKTSIAAEESDNEDKEENSDVKDKSMEEDSDKEASKEESDEDEIKSTEGDESKEQIPTPKSKENSGSKSKKPPTGINEHNPNKPSESKQKSKRTTKISDVLAKDSASPSQVKGSSSKKQKPESETKKVKSADQKDSSRKQSGKLGSKSVTKEGGKGKTSKKKDAGPSTKELQAVAENILKEVDFNTATLSDIVQKLGNHFGLDLMHRKTEVKKIIADVINNMSDSEDDEEEDGDDDDDDGNKAEKDESDDDNA